MEDLYVDSEIGQVFTVNLGQADQEAPAGDSAASLGAVEIYRLSASEVLPPGRVEVAGLIAPAAAEDGAEGPVIESETAPAAAAAADDDEEMEPAGQDAVAAPAEETTVAAPEATVPQAAPQTAPQSDPSATRPPASKTPDSSKDSPRTPPPAASSAGHPPTLPPIR